MKKFIKILTVMYIIIMYLPLLATSVSVDIFATNSSASQSTKDVDTDELTSEDWALITNSNSDSKANSFDFIKNNTNDSNNGKWMLYGGITLIALSVIGILYVIFSTMAPNLKNK